MRDNTKTQCDFLRDKTTGRDIPITILTQQCGDALQVLFTSDETGYRDTLLCQNIVPLANKFYQSLDDKLPHSLPRVLNDIATSSRSLPQKISSMAHEIFLGSHQTVPNIEFFIELHNRPKDGYSEVHKAPLVFSHGHYVESGHDWELVHSKVRIPRPSLASSLHP